MPGTKLKVLHVRTWKNRDGSDGKWWTEVGTAWMSDKGIDVTLHYLPLAPPDGGPVRLTVREDDGPGAQAPQGGFQGQQRQRPPQGQGFQQGRPQGAAQGFQGGGLRPQHRDALQGPPAGAQGAQYGGAAAAFDQGGSTDGDDNLPF